MYMGNDWLYKYLNQDSGINGWTNGQVQNGLAIGNTGLSAAQLAASAYFNQQNLNLQKQALALQQANQAQSQKIQANKALASANILGGMARGLANYNNDANIAAVKAAYAPNTTVIA